MPFHQVLTGALVAGAAAVNLNPTGIGGRILTEADSWALFRIRAFKARLHRTNATVAQVLGFVGGVQDTPPATTGAIMELLPAVYMSPTYTVPTPWAKCSSMQLAGPFPWYKSVPGTQDASEESPGQLVLAGSGTESYVIELVGVIEFKTSIDPGNTPELALLIKKAREERARVAREKERVKLLGALGTPSQKP